jgi:hypothetical protein
LIDAHQRRAAYGNGINLLVLDCLQQLGVLDAAVHRLPYSAVEHDSDQYECGDKRYVTQHAALRFFQTLVLLAFKGREALRYLNVLLFLDSLFIEAIKIDYIIVFHEIPILKHIKQPHSGKKQARSQLYKCKSYHRETPGVAKGRKILPPSLSFADGRWVRANRISA